MKTIWAIDESNHDDYNIIALFENEDEVKRTLAELEKSVNLKRGEYSNYSIKQYSLHEEKDKSKCNFQFEFTVDGSLLTTNKQYVLNEEEFDGEILGDGVHLGPDFAWSITIWQASETYENAKEKAFKKVKEFLKKKE